MGHGIGAAPSECSEQMNQRVKSEAKEYLPLEDRPPESLLKRMLLTHASGEYGTPHGRMLLRGELNSGQYAACKWFDDLYGRYLAAIDRPRGIRTSSGERIEPGHAPDPFSPVGWDAAIVEQITVKQFDSARMAAMACGLYKFRSFWFVVIEDTDPVGYADKRAVAEVAMAVDKHRTRSWKSRRKK